MARVWVAKQGLHCVLNVGTYRDSKFREAMAWGVMLADMARHLSDALVAAGLETSRASALKEIRDTMARELKSPTSEVAGEFKQTKQ